MKITVDVAGHDPGYPSMECPLRNSEYGHCQAHSFLRPGAKEMECPVGVEVEDGPTAGMYLYLIPAECPLRKGSLSIESKR